MYEGGRPRGFDGFIGSEELEELALEGGESEFPDPGGGVTVLFGGATLLEDLRLEPTRFFKRAFMEDMNERTEKKRAGRRRGEKGSRYFWGGGRNAVNFGLLELSGLSLPANTA